MKKGNELVPSFGVLPTIELPKDYSVDKASVEQRDLLVIKSKGLKPIVDTETNEIAIATGVEIRKVIKAVDEAFATLKRPLLDAGKLLATLRDNYVAPLLAEQQRLEQQAAVFRRAENERIDKERREQEAKERQARLYAQEAQRKADELALKAKGTKTLAKAMEAQAEANKAQEAFIVTASAPVVELVKPKGSSFCQVQKSHVVDIGLVYQHNPRLCKPLEISPAAVKATCFAAKGATKENPDRQIPGLLLWWEDDVSFTSR